ncbi:protein kinase subdomain-containing protein, partial [Metarhizium majus ARSEF 297]
MLTEIQGRGDLAIKDTAMRRYLTLLAMITIARFYRCDGPCVPISPCTIVKKCKSTNLTEAATMAFIASKTNIPVPHVYCSFIRKNSTYIVMERVPGKTLAAAWPGLSDLERENILMQLRSIVRELRALPPPDQAVQSCVGGSLRDSRIPRPEPRFGPFRSILAFHYWLREGLQLEQCPDDKNDDKWTEIRRMIVMQDRELALPVFTHGDLNPFNILVQDGQIVAIIDWEFSGWYPFYWEYTSAWLGNKTRQAWQNLIPKFIDPCPEELEMEAIRQKWWGDF